MSFQAITIWEEVYYVMFTLLFTGSCIGVCLVGFYKNDAFFRRVSLVFLVLELFTKYCEYGWNSIHKTAFFFGLSGLFFLIGFKGKYVVEKFGF